MTDEQPVFNLATPARAWKLKSRMAWVKAHHGVGAWKQLWAMIRLRVGKGKLEPLYYAKYGLYRADLSAAERSGYVSVAKSRRINKLLSPKDVAVHRNFLNDKIAYALLLDRVGVAVAKTHMMYHPLRKMGTLPCVDNETGIAEFLRNKSVYPLFCKPVKGSRGVGAVKLDGLAEDENKIRIADGREVSIDRFAEAVATGFPDGYLFQAFVVQHPDILEYSSTAVGTVRVVTLMQDSGPEIAYVIWKIPAEGAMADNAGQSMNNKDLVLSAMIDKTSGKIAYAISTKGFDRTNHDIHPTTGKPLVGYQLPNWDLMVKTVKETHMITPGHGVLGWDVALGENGPIIIECNPMPIHTFYQNVAQKPLMFGEMGDIFGSALKHAKTELKRVEALEIEALKRNVTAKVNAAMLR